MFKKILLNWALPMILELLAEAMVIASKRTDTTVDDSAAEKFAENTDKLMDIVKSNL